MEVAIHQSWSEILKVEFEKPYFQELVAFVKAEYGKNRCFPKGSEIFSAFDHAPFEKVKVVIIGQDPYHGPGQAHGLCFSVREGTPLPPSLVNIFKELEEDTGRALTPNGDLTSWAAQGVLLLNATMTVRAGQAGSHQNKGWEKFTDAVIRLLSEHGEGLVFLLWGGYAKRKALLINADKHHILTSGHPSPLSANRGLWFGNRHFSKTNAILTEMGKTPIIW